MWWDTKKLDDATCLYGEITVLATYPGIYFCGANWHPGDPAGGYCGIQHNSPTERRTIFSIWDTSLDHRARVTTADGETIFNRFDNEGSGAHTHMLWNWQLSEPFQFFLCKQPGLTPGSTDARYFVFDRTRKRWRHSATINSPNGDSKSEVSVARIGGGGLASFLEDFRGFNRSAAKLALYRLWLGSAVEGMQCLTQGESGGIWGQLSDAYFKAEGGQNELNELFERIRDQYGSPVFGQEGKKLSLISDKPIPPGVIEELKALPEASNVC